ncbi:MAG: LapA family protein [Proteobacteria bacterium]|nr:LapA family protein [Pseudomonadota bacterium]
MYEPSLMPVWAWNAVAVVAGAIIAGLIGMSTAWKLHQWETARTKKTIGKALHAELELLIMGVEGAVKGGSDDPLAVFQTLAYLNETTLIYRQNTDNIGLFGDLSGTLVGAYANIIFWIGRGREFDTEFKAVEYDPHRRDATVHRLRSDAADYMDGLKAWLDQTRELHNRLGLMCDIGTTAGKRADPNDG